MSLGSVERIANAILYEGYLLYPYRASALKNQRRWNFGVVYPRAYSGAQGGIDPWTMQTECLCEAGPLSALQIKVRFLRLAESAPLQNAEDTEISLPERRVIELAASPTSRDFVFEGGLEARVTARAVETESSHWKITVLIENLTPCPGGDVLLRSLVSTHTILRVRDGEFVSLIDPPEEFRELAELCINQGTWPVLAGEEGKRDTILSSPIILYDYPQIAPESPGDLFDGTEIDEILTLRILTMTDAEKEEVRRTDPRARQVLERTEALPPEDFMRLHGVLRAAVYSVGGES